MPKTFIPPPQTGEPASATLAAAPAWLELVTQKVAGLQYGVVQIVIHDSKVVQIESTERHRFDLRGRAEVVAHK